MGYGVKVGGILALALGAIGLGYALLGERQATAQRPRPEAAANRPIPVDLVVVQAKAFGDDRRYPITAAPQRESQLRARVEGRLVELTVDVGDRLEAGQLVGRLDDGVLRATLLQAEAELAAREAEWERLRAEVRDSEAQLERAQLEAARAKLDAQRSAELVAGGVISQQRADLDRTTAEAAQRGVRSAQERRQAQQQGVAAGQRRIEAQRALVAQARERLSFTELRSPTAGVVMARIVDVGDLLQPGGAVLQVGDFGQIKAIAEISELGTGALTVGQGATVTFDALPGRVYSGEIARIAPSARVDSRLVPIEVQLRESEGLRGGMLGQVRFASPAAETLVIPQTALRVGGDRPVKAGETGKIFVALAAESGQYRAAAREVVLGGATGWICRRGFRVKCRRNRGGPERSTPEGGCPTGPQFVVGRPHQAIHPITHNASGVHHDKI
ncbi:MAG: HlyD family efflux transporter periplasmic adaptor subunit [Oscillatoriales cyanobacterium SM2_1_8]|nr:HlyD family efflux transporter periplasmic adaptor subunit [Oscillatoriales cyanobacterium SM2_1_8]